MMGVLLGVDIQTGDQFMNKNREEKKAEPGQPLSLSL